jgi:hypothetical protein
VGDAAPPSLSSFAFELEDRVQCMDSGRVSYRRQGARLLPLDIPLDAAVNSGEVASFKEREAKRQRLKVGRRRRRRRRGARCLPARRVQGGKRTRLSCSAVLERRQAAGPGIDV